MYPKTSVLFLLPYPLNRAPSQRFRVELFLPVLQKRDIPFQVHSFLDEKTWNVLYQSGSIPQKICGVCKGFLSRLMIVLFTAYRYDYIFIHREASPLGPPIFEFILIKLLRKKVVYDFDDAIWIPDTGKQNLISNWLKAYWKVRFICKWCYKISAGNAYLAAFASQYAGSVAKVPTCVDTERFHNVLKDQHTNRVVVGWTGSHSTMKYLEMLLPVLSEVAKENDIDVLIISNTLPTFELQNLHFKPWNEASEVEDLARMNIGLMPLESDTWSEGKCGFKLIQYLAIGIPAIASPIGVNKEIIEEGINGYLATSESEWKGGIEKLIHDSTLRSEMGRNGRLKIVENYSIQANSDSFISLFS